MWLSFCIIFSLIAISIETSCTDNQTTRQTDASVKEYKIIDGIYVAEAQQEPKAMQQYWSFFDRALGYFRNYELRVRLSDIIDGKTENESSRKKNEGMGVLLTVGAMLAKFLTASGFVSLSVLVLKSFIVANIALVLAVILGLKKLVSNHYEHHNHNHKRNFGDEFRKRRKRDIDQLVYSAWQRTN